MDRSTLKAIGLLLLIPSLCIGLFPLLVNYTQVASGMHDFSLTAGNTVVAQLTHSQTGAANVTVWPGVWVVAAIGELVLMSIAFFQPVRQSRFRITLS